MAQVVEFETQVLCAVLKKKRKGLLGAECGNTHLSSHLLKRLWQEGCEFKVSLDNVVRPYLQQKKAKTQLLKNH
jgi:hypothetical protein